MIGASNIMRTLCILLILFIGRRIVVTAQGQTNNTNTCSSCAKEDIHNYDGKPLLLHLNSVPLYYNPSFAGAATEGKSRLAMDYKNKLWECGPDSSVNGDIHKYSDPLNYHFSYDQLIEPIHAGIGIIAYKTYKYSSIYYQSHDSILKSSYFDTAINQWVYQYQAQYLDHYLDLPSTSFYYGAAYSQKISIKQKVTLAPSIKIGYVTDNLRKGWNSSGNYLPPPPVLKDKNSYLDISTGFLINTDKFYAGFTIDHINKPKVADFISVVALRKLPLYIYQGGYTYQKDKDSKWALSCNLFYARQQKKKYSSSIINLSCKYRWASVGVSSSSECGDMLSVLFGMHGKNFTIGYSKNVFTRHYNFGRNLSDITIVNTHEISIKYLFGLKKKQAQPNKLQMQ